MGVSTRSIGGVLVEIVGRERVHDDPGVTGAHVVDGVVPRWVVRPASTDHVAGVLALATEEGLGVVPRGSGSALELGRPPRRLDVVLDLGGLDRVLEDNPADLTLSVEAGATLGAIAGGRRERGQFLPLDPPGAARRSVGGVVATAASGPLRFRYGTPRDLLLGARFVQADGTVTWGGARVVKSVTGYDVPKLLVGSLGTLGVLTELTLRLHPVPDVERTWLVRCPGPAGAQDLVAALLGSTIQPGRIEWLNGAALEACGLGPEGTGVAVSIGSVEAAVVEQGERLTLLARAAGLAAEPLGAAFWERYAAVAGGRPGTVTLGVATVTDRVADAAAVAEQAVAGGVSTITGSAALGLLTMELPPATDAAAVVEALHGHVTATGGSVIVRRGPAALRAGIDPWGPVAPEVFALMQALKAEFDPRGVLNPGRFVGGL